MINREDLESFFIRMGVEAEEVDENIWVLHGEEDAPTVVVTYAPPVVVLRLKVLDLPTEARDEQLAPLYRKLLELNASDLVHGSYGIEEGDVALTTLSEGRWWYPTMVMAPSFATMNKFSN
jgi:hypothetical protein